MSNHHVRAAEAHADMLADLARIGEIIAALDDTQGVVALMMSALDHQREWLIERHDVQYLTSSGARAALTAVLDGWTNDNSLNREIAEMLLAKAILESEEIESSCHGG